MTTEHIAHRDIADFADQYVNLRRDDAKKYRNQVNALREKLEKKLAEEQDFQLKRMLLSGSLAKRSALKQIHDIDVAVYVKQDSPPQDMPIFLAWLTDTLRNLYPNMNADQITPQDHSVCISFRGTGLDVDIVPISYDGNECWDGYLYSTRRNDWVLTNISRHLEFIQRRKTANNPHFIQVARLLKYWIKQVKKRDDGFRFKSFMVELILAHLADNGKIRLDDYVEALAGFYDYIIKSGLQEIIAFSDYYGRHKIHASAAPVQIYDPVNPANNAALGYSESDRIRIVDEAAECADAIDAALYAVNKSDTIRYWQKIFGSSFGG